MFQYTYQIYMLMMLFSVCPEIAKTTKQELENGINSEIKLLSQWFQVNKLSLNAKKQRPWIAFHLLWRQTNTKISPELGLLLVWPQSTCVFLPQECM